ncbi:chalcone isomerase family protein [Methylophaga sulfidovorans]|uniref:Chalcone isomerase-like n=1 Tax=Methylophaga sulfidovorans TaxID=45496 RepID=A0A1I3VI50_9GAMM|nr:chalcone isomerase family protein [Methylophaga sulfidovorans]SFJ94729.1 Chalcone isomerase-like [Methylophaga sulfidovorans]
MMFRLSPMVMAIFFSSLTWADNSFPDSLPNTSPSLQKCHETAIDVMAFIDVADAALYLFDCNKLPEIRGEKQLSFLYHRAIKGADFVEAAETLLKRNLSVADYKAIEVELKRFNAAYEDVKDGDSYDIRQTQNGLYLFKNGRQLAHSSSSLLAESYYQIWFGTDPFDTDLKQDLLAPISNQYN